MSFQASAEPVDAAAAVRGPRVSVGIPTYNRPAGLKRTLSLISAQTYANLEIIVSDNCSSDPQVAAVIESFAAADPRFRCVRQPVNVGAAANYRNVLSLARGEFFLGPGADVYEGMVVGESARPDDMVINVPGLYLMTWYDVSIGPNLALYNHVRETASPEIGKQQYAMIAPTLHCGYKRATEHTVVGDTVNLASRIENLTRTLDIAMLVSEAVIEAVKREGGGGELAGLRDLGTHDIRGYGEGLRLWGLTAQSLTRDAESG